MTVSANPRRLSPRHIGLVLATALVLVAALVIAQRQSTSPTETQATASTVEMESALSTACLNSMIDAAQKGDVARYRQCFTGDLLRQLDDRLAAKNAPQNPGDKLKSAVTGLMGVAVSPAELLPSADKAEAVLDLVFADHNTRQQVVLRRVEGEWKIESWTEPTRLRPDILYGTPVEGR